MTVKTFASAFCSKLGRLKLPFWCLDLFSPQCSVCVCVRVAYCISPHCAMVLSDCCTSSLTLQSYTEPALYITLDCVCFFFFCLEKDKYKTLCGKLSSRTMWFCNSPTTLSPVGSGSTGICLVPSPSWANHSPTVALGTLVLVSSRVQGL